MNHPLTTALDQASAVLDHASIVTTAFKQLKDKTSDMDWTDGPLRELTDGPLGELLKALTDLEYEIEAKVFC